MLLKLAQAKNYRKENEKPKKTLVQCEKCWEKLCDISKD